MSRNDPTSKRRRESALLRRLPLHAFLEAMPDAVSFYDAEGGLVFANRVGWKLLGLSVDPDFVGKLPPQRNRRLRYRDMRGAALPREQWHVTRLLNGETIGSDQPVLMRFTSLDGVERFISVTGAPIYDEDGVLLGAIAIARDNALVQELQRRTQDSLQALLEMSEAVVTVTTLGSADAETPPAREVGQRLIELARQVLGCKRMSITSVDADTRIMRAWAVTGLSPEEERRWWAQRAEATERGVRFEESTSNIIAQKLLTGAPLTLDLRDPAYAHVPNDYGIVTLMIAPMVVARRLVGFISLDYAGDAHEFSAEELNLAAAVSKLAALVFERDRMLREQAAVEARALALAQGNQRMNEFLGIAAHELRTPITVIRANLQILQRDTLREIDRSSEADTPRAARQAKLLGRTERSLMRLTRLVDDLLDTSRMQAGKLDLRIEQVDLAQVVVEAVEEQRLATPERAIVVTVEAQAPITTCADGARVGQVVTNYLTNALKYSSAATPVRVRLAVDGAVARVSVSDSGVGIPADHLDEVWEIFHRIPGVEVVSGSGIGLGLGLHLCKTIIERHGGEIGCASVLGAGSTFWFSLPLTDQPATAGEASV